MKHLANKDLVAIAYIDKTIDFIQDYFRSFELKDEDDLFTIIVKTDKISRIKLHIYIDGSDNETVMSIKDFEYAIKDKNALIKMLDDELYYVVLKTDVIIEVNTKINYIGIRMWNQDSLYRDNVIYVAPKGCNASIFISELKKQVKKFEKDGNKK
jgi:hypothetical protein